MHLAVCSPLFKLRIVVNFSSSAVPGLHGRQSAGFSASISGSQTSVGWGSRREHRRNGSIRAMWPGETWKWLGASTFRQKMKILGIKKKFYSVERSKSCVLLHRPWIHFHRRYQQRKRLRTKTFSSAAFRGRIASCSRKGLDARSEGLTCRGPALCWRSVRGSHADPNWPQGLGVQLPLRRSRDSGEEKAEVFFVLSWGGREIKFVLEVWSPGNWFFHVLRVLPFRNVIPIIFKFLRHSRSKHRRKPLLVICFQHFVVFLCLFQIYRSWNEDHKSRVLQNK